MTEAAFPPEVEEILDDIIKEYESVFKNIQGKAKEEPEERAYGGIIRSTTGKFVEWMARQLVQATWITIDKESGSLTFKKKKYKLPILEEYVEKIKVPEVKQHIQSNIGDYTYGIGQDVHVYEGENFLLSIECKSYAENAMLKRIIVDAWFLGKIFPSLKFALIQLESQLGGDYSEVKEIPFGSGPSHTIMSYFDVDLTIITLLEGARKVDEPIHKPKFYKPLKKENLRKAVRQLGGLLTR